MVQNHRTHDRSAPNAQRSGLRLSAHTRHTSPAPPVVMAPAARRDVDRAGPHGASPASSDVTSRSFRAPACPLAAGARSAHARPVSARASGRGTGPLQRGALRKSPGRAAAFDTTKPPGNRQGRTAHLVHANRSRARTWSLAISQWAAVEAARRAPSRRRENAPGRGQKSRRP